MLSVLLLAGLTIALVAVVSFTVLDVGTALAREPTTASFEATSGPGGVVLTHVAGDRLRTQDLTVLLERDGVRETVAGADLGSGTVSSGDSLVVPHGFGPGDVDVTVRHDPSNTIPYRTTLTIVQPPLLATFDFSVSGRDVTLVPTVSGGVPGHAPIDLSGIGGEYADQGTGDVDPDGTTATVAGNGWPYVEIEYRSTEDTVLAFEFRADSYGSDPAADGRADIQGFVLEDDLTNQHDWRNVLQVTGAQGTLKSTNVTTTGAPAYHLGDGWVRYEVPVDALGRTPTVATVLVLVNDDDGGQWAYTAVGGDSQSSFRNVMLYEAGTDYDYRWTVDGRIYNAESPVVRLPAGNHEATLVVTDAAGNSVTATETVVVP